MDHATMSELTQAGGVVTGEIMGVDDAGQPLVSWNGLASVAAHAVWTPSAPPWTDCVGTRVLVGFLNGDETRPIILGLLGPPPTQEKVDPPAGRMPETLRVQAGRELVIECGEAKIWLRKDGRIEIRGTHLVSRSSGPNKIKGGSVFIN
jgi:hypothetical protein